MQLPCDTLHCKGKHYFCILQKIYDFISAFYPRSPFSLFPFSFFLHIFPFPQSPYSYFLLSLRVKAFFLLLLLFSFSRLVPEDDYSLYSNFYAMTRKLSIFCKNTNTDVAVEGGTSLLQLLDSLPIPICDSSSRPICALVNNKTEALDFQLFSPKQVEFIYPSSSIGREVYIRSLCMMTYRAVRTLFHEARLKMELSVSNGYFFRISDKEGNPVTPHSDFSSRLLDTLRTLADRDIPFIRHELPTPQAIEIFRKEGLYDKTALLESIGDLYTVFYTLDDVSDSYYGPLAPSTGYITQFDILPHGDGFLLLGPDPDMPSRPAAPLMQPKLFKAFADYLDFNRVIRVTDVADLNRAIVNGSTTDLINVAEAMHNKFLGRIADRIAERRAMGHAGIVMIAGPSSSGKTTSCKRLAIQLMTNCIVPKMISLDDYFVDREKTPLDENGDYDYEHLHALDLVRFKSDLTRLLAGEEINLPTYSFETGSRIERPRPLRLEPSDVLLIEGIHGLNPELTQGIPPEAIFKVYVSALTTLRIDDHNWISTSDNRLLRRIVRDHKYRHTSAAETIRRWPSVRRGEEKWIFPFQENADATFNSSLIFEIGVMKDYAEPLLRDVPHNEEVYAQAYRLLRFLHYFKSVPADQVPSTSLLREFLGGSSFRY